MLGTRWDLVLGGGNSHAGTYFDQALTFPFVGELGRWAARQSFRRRDRYFDMVAAELPEGFGASSPGEVHLLVPLREKAMELSIVRRFGRRGSLSLLGGALSFQELSYPGGRDASILWEFAAEGQRWFDLVRTGTLEELVPQAKPGVVPQQKHYLFPIPQRERDVNPNLPQNNY